MARRTARDGDWIVWGTCGQVPRILTFRPRCWRFTRNKWCGREFRTFGNTSQSRWKSVLQWRVGRRGATTVDYILDQALRWHVTSVNIKSSPIPSEWESQFENFQ